MAQAASVSLKNFTASVNKAVKAAQAKHPKFQLETAQGISVSYLIRGIPVPDGVLRNVSVTEIQAFAADVAQQVAGAHEELFRATGQSKPEGVVLSVGGRIIIGIPPVDSFLLTE